MELNDIGGGPSGGTPYTLLSYGATSTLTLGDFAVTNLTSLALDTSFGTNGVFLDTTAKTLQVQFVPEPSSAALLGLAGVALLRRRRR